MLDHITRLCLSCNEALVRRINENSTDYADRRYCSRACFYKGMGKNPRERHRTCATCGTPILRRKYCSPNCRREGIAKAKYDGKGNKRCGKCGQWKPSSEFYRHIKGGRRHPHCNICALEQREQWWYQNRDRMYERRAARLNDLDYKIGRMLMTIRQRAKKKGLEYKLTVGDVLSQWEKQQGLCFYSGVLMTNINGEGRCFTNFSIDRVDSKCGYTPDNIVLCCEVVNRMKIELSVDNFLNWIATIYQHSQESDFATGIRKNS